MSWPTGWAEPALILPVNATFDWTLREILGKHPDALHVETSWEVRWWLPDGRQGTAAVRTQTGDFPVELTKIIALMEDVREVTIWG